MMPVCSTGVEHLVPGEPGVRAGNSTGQRAPQPATALLHRLPTHIEAASSASRWQPTWSRVARPLATQSYSILRVGHSLCSLHRVAPGCGYEGTILRDAWHTELPCPCRLSYSSLFCHIVACFDRASVLHTALSGEAMLTWRRGRGVWRLGRWGGRAGW